MLPLPGCVELTAFGLQDIAKVYVPGSCPPSQLTGKLNQAIFV